MKARFLPIVFTMLLSTAMMASCNASATMQQNPAVKSGVTKAKPDTLPVAAPAGGIMKAPDKKPTYGDDSAQCVLNYYLYRQSFRDWENSGDMFYFDDLLPSWTYVFVHCPGYRVNTFINGTKIYEHRISLLPEKERNGAIDTLLMIYDERINYFGDGPFVLGQKATAMVQYYPDKTEALYDLLAKAVKQNGRSTPNHLLVFYMQYAINMYDAGKITIETLIDIYLEVDEIAHYNMDLNNETSVEYAGGIARIEQMMLNYLECSVMEDVFLPRFQADSTNLDLCKKIVALMAYNKCYDQTLFRRALNQLNRMEPTPKLLLFQARFYQNDGNYTEAEKSYIKAAESFGPGESDDKFDAYLKAAEVQLFQKKYTQAKSSVLKALEIKSEDASAHIMLGDIYLYGAETCGSTIIAKYAGYWAAYDRYQRARNATSDPSLQSKANEGMNNAKRRFPPTSELFFNSLKPGQTATAPCWIGETVTIRASDS